MLYSILQFIIRKSLAIHYRRVKSFHKTAIETKGPLIVASSHPNSFLDAIVLAAIIDQPLHFLARGDVFNKPWTSYLLRQLNLVPIYRLSEGTENLHKNQDTFSKCHEILENNGAILVFPEGVSKLDKEIHPLRKGVARIAFSYLEKKDYRSKLSIISVGINYDNPKKFHNRIFVGFGSPFTLNPWIKTYKTNHNKAFVDFNQYLLYSLQKQSIEVEKKDFELHEALCQIDPSYQVQSLDRMSLIAKNIQRLKNDSAEDYNTLKSITLQTRKQLNSHGLAFKHLKHPIKINSITIILNVLLLPLSIFGLLFNTWPFVVGKKIAGKLPKKHDQFIYSVRFATATFSWLIVVLLLTILLTAFLSQWFLFTPIIFYWSLLSYNKLYITIKKIRLIRRLSRLKNKEKEHAAVIENIKKIIDLRNKFNIIPKE